MYVRPPNQDRQRIRIPENYGGNAFLKETRANEMPPPIRQLSPVYESSATDNTDTFAEDALDKPKGDLPFDENKKDASVSTSAEQKKPDRNSIFSSLLPPGIDFSTRFPFGHGIGREEVIILAVMLLVYLSDSDGDGCDHELILLLGLLLLAG